MSRPGLTGGCQCGAVRYRLNAAPSGTHFCHCSMCRRAVGGPFAALAGVPKADLEWTKGEPAIYASSSIAERPFCRECGTPLGFWYKDSARGCVTLGSLDEPEAAPIALHWGVESKLSWLKLCDGLPEKRTDDELDAQEKARLAGMTSHQRTDA